MSQGVHVVDVAVHYPVVSLLAGERPGAKAPDYNLYMKLSHALYDTGIDNDIVDDDSILSAEIRDGRIFMAGNGYQALVFGPESTVRRSVMQKALDLARSGGTVVFYGKLPLSSAEGGRDDSRLKRLIEDLLGPSQEAGGPANAVAHRVGDKGFAAFLAGVIESLPQTVSEHIERDFMPKGGTVYVQHRRIGNLHVYLVQNAEENAIDFEAACRVDGVPEVWDSFTGEVTPVDAFERSGGTTRIRHRLHGNVATLFVFRPGEKRSGATSKANAAARTKGLSDDWTFSVIPTRDNRWGEFRWPPSPEGIGPEIRAFRYAEEGERSGVELGWNRPDFDDGKWAEGRYSIGPYWLVLEIPPDADKFAEVVLTIQDRIHADAMINSRKWRKVEFSKTIGLARPAPWGGHSGYPDGAIDQNFVELPKGRKLLFTRLRSPKEQRLGLRVELRNSSARLWVNGTEQPFEDAVGNLPLRAGENAVLLEILDGGTGMLYVQAQPPSVRSLEDAARGMPKPDLRAARWIRDPGNESGYLRKTFVLDRVPEQARVLVTAYTGFRLFVNGVKVEEEIGPWARWTHPESFNISARLRKGKNVIAAWNQIYAGQHVKGQTDMKGFVLAMKARHADGKEFDLVSDGSWKGTINEEDGWERPGFDDADWPRVKVLGQMGSKPWGMTPVENLGAVTEPRRRLAIDLPSPILTCFDEVPGVVYDIKPEKASRIGWYRFKAPPGLAELHLRTKAGAQVWIDGKPAAVSNGVVRPTKPPRGVSTVAIRLEMEPGAYGGAAFPLPLGITLEGGVIQAGPWSDFAMPTYSGIGVYRQRVQLSKEDAASQIELNLGEVLVAAEVFVNGQSAGVRLARPFTFDLTGLATEGANELEVRVANTIAPHYTVTNRVHNLGPTKSGLIGPVKLNLYPPIH